MTDSSILKIGFIGAGDVSLLHAEAVGRCKGARLRGLWNRTQSNANSKAELFGCRTYSTPEELCADPEIDAVFILTNLETHHKYSLLALQHGKHVLVEKPVAATIDEIKDIRNLAQEKQVVCVPGHNYVYEESLMRTRRLLLDGDLGRLISVYVLYNIHHPEEVARRYPGVIRQILTHHSYILLFLAGAPRRVSALKATLHYEELENEDIALVNIQTANGALAHFCASFAADDHAADPWTVQIRVIGTKGSTRYSYRDWVELKPAVVHSQTYSAYLGSICNEVEYFVSRCIGNGEPPLSTLEDAILAQQLIEAIEESVEQGKTVECCSQEGLK